MNYILENTNQVRCFTDMREVFEAANIAPQDYDWYVSDVEANGAPRESLPFGWVTGDVLASFVKVHEVQFEWAVFSAVPKGFRSRPSSDPYADGNPNFWVGEGPMPQLHGAIFEIVCWDSSATILINFPPEAARSFSAKFPDTRPLVTSPL